MRTKELRRRYLDFFQSKGHVLVPSDTLVPDDQSLLFTSAGMNQFKAYFLGEKKDINRAVSCQKCFRTGDLERVGKTAYHHTFFEMLGNFSFGDYFKKEAIEYAWEFLGKELNIPEKDLSISVYKDDEEAYRIWREHIGIASERIARFGEESNFWPASAPSLGPDGVCGPCSEIFFDRGTHTGCRSGQCNPDCNCGRFVEIWNLVFTQFNRVGENNLLPLPQKNIDTGMGLERMACVLQGKTSNFEIDTLLPLVRAVKDILKTEITNERSGAFIHAIVDHARAAIFAIADGVYPSNEERGYVVRKIIRKAVFHANSLGYKKSFLHTLVPLVIESMSDFYSELSGKQGVIEKVIGAEEDKFINTLKDGQDQLRVVLEDLKKNNKNTVDSETLFRLYDTWGFPLELSKAIAVDYGMGVDEEGFNFLLKLQRERSRSHSMFDENIFKKSCDLKEKSLFLGYEMLTSKSRIIHLCSICPGSDDFFKQRTASLEEDQQGVVIADVTPFYAESGGQLADQGRIHTEGGEFLVEKVFKANDAIVHKGKVIHGSINEGEASFIVDPKRRKALARAHSATHLLQAALRKVLGDHVVQQGSFVDADRFRFDFTHFKALTAEELAAVEKLVNEYILEAEPILKQTLSLQEAKEQGALAFFKDKYEQTVRVISIAGYSKELCGGTHLSNTAEAGSFIIESESSISSGVRRIEALVGQESYDFLRLGRLSAAEAAKLLKTDIKCTPAAVREIMAQLRAANARISSYERQMSLANIENIIAQRQIINGVNFIACEIKNQDYESLFCISDALKQKEKSLFVFLVSRGDKNIFVSTATEDLARCGKASKQFVNACGGELGLRGGGKDSAVQGVIAGNPDNFLKRLVECFKTFSV